MEEYIQVSAKTKSEAITKAAIELGTASDELDIIVVSEGSSGFFGIGSKPAVIKARRKAEEVKKEEDLEKIEKEAIETVTTAAEAVKEEITRKKTQDERPARENKRHHAKGDKENSAKKEMKEKVHKEKPVKEKPVKEKISKQTEILTDPQEIEMIKEKAKVFLDQVFAAMNLEVNIKMDYDKEEGCLVAEFLGDDMGILIGKRGQTLDSLQYLTSLVVNKNRQGYIRVKLDTEDYRRRRKETLENLARGIAYKVKKTRKPVVLEPMNPYERRIIHSALQGNRYVETTSEGEEPYRHVVVKLKRDRDR